MCIWWWVSAAGLSPGRAWWSLVWLVVELGLLVVQGGLSPPCHVPGCSLGCMFHIIHGVMSHSILWDLWGGRCEAVSGGMSHPPSPSLGSTRVSPTVKPKPLTCCSWPWSGSWDFQMVYREETVPANSLLSLGVTQLGWPGCGPWPPWSLLQLLHSRAGAATGAAIPKTKSVLGAAPELF